MRLSKSSSNVAAAPRVPLITAFGATAEGLMLQLRSDPVGILEVPELQSILVAIHVGRAAKVSCRRGGVSHTGSAVHGDIDIVPALTPSRWEIHDDNDTALILGLPNSLLATVAEEQGFDSRHIEIKNRFQIRDAQLENICWALKAEMQSGYPSGRLYVDSLAVSAASRLVASHSSRMQREIVHRGGLGGRRYKQTLAFIEDHLADDLSLACIASTAGVSSSHFKTLFRESAGVPLHQYVLQRRIDRAKDMLMQGHLSIAEIALATGFSHQSHLARHMRRSVGLSPRAVKQLFAETSSIFSK